MMMMMRLCLGMFEKDLGHRFGISESTVSIIFCVCIHFLCQELEGFVSFLSRSLSQDKMPNILKELYPKTVFIIDAVEFRMQSPLALDLNSACYSSYKETTTMKGLVGISPLGVVSFMIELYTGSISDKELRLRPPLIDSKVILVFIHICTQLFISGILPHILSLFTRFYFTPVYKPHAEYFFLSLMMPWIGESLDFKRF